MAIVIPKYTQVEIQPRQVAQAYNPQAIAAAGQTYAQPIAEVSNFATKIAEAENAIAVADAVQTQQKNKFDMYLKSSQEWQNNPGGFADYFSTQIQDIDKSVRENLRSEKAKRDYDEKVASTNFQYYQKASVYEQDRRIQIIVGNFERSTEELVTNASALGGGGEDWSTVSNAIAAQRDAAVAVLPIEQVDKHIRNITENAANAFAAALVSANPDAGIEQIRAGKIPVSSEQRAKLEKFYFENQPDIFKVYGNPNTQQKPSLGDGSFEYNIGNLLNIEGGYNKNDGGSGFPVIYGINEKWWPKEFKEAMRITQEQGEAAGKAYAEGFYKREYWDKYDLESVPLESRAIVFDGIVNQGLTKLVDAAKSGATPEQLLQIRAERYKKTAQQPGMEQNFNGWMNRLSSFGNRPNSPYQDAKALERIKKDPVQAMKEADLGKTVQERVEWQFANLGTPRELAAVMSSVESETTAQAFANTKTVDEFIGLSRQVKQTYGEYAENAIRQIAGTNKLTDVQQVALRLATDNENTYRQHIEFVYKSNVKDARSNLNAGKDETDVESPSKMIDNALSQSMKKNGITAALYTEGFSDADISQRLNTYKAIAYNYKLSNPGATPEKAAEFALQPVLGTNAYKEFNGSFFRVSKKFMDEADTISDNIKPALENIIQRYNESGGFFVESGTATSTIERGGIKYEVDDIRVEMTEDGKSLLVKDAADRLFIVDNQPLRLDFAWLLNPNLQQVQQNSSGAPVYTVTNPAAKRMMEGQ